MMKVTVEAVGDGGRRTVATIRIGPGPDGTHAVAALDGGDPSAGIAPGTAGCIGRWPDGRGASGACLPRPAPRSRPPTGWSSDGVRSSPDESLN
jgi:hypothetical protein